MKIINRRNCFALAILACAALLGSSRAAYSLDFTVQITGTIQTVQITGAPDLGIAVGDPFTAIARFEDEHPSPSNPFGGESIFDHVQVLLQFSHGLTYQSGPDAHGVQLLSGEQDTAVGDGGELLGPGVDYAQYFGAMAFDLSFYNQFGFEGAYVNLYASDGPTPWSPDQASLAISGFASSHQIIAVPDAAPTMALLAFGIGIVLLVSAPEHRVLRRG